MLILRYSLRLGYRDVWSCCCCFFLCLLCAASRIIWTTLGRRRSRLSANVVGVATAAIAIQRPAVHRANCVLFLFSSLYQQWYTCSMFVLEHCESLRLHPRVVLLSAFPDMCILRWSVSASFLRVIVFLPARSVQQSDDQCLLRTFVVVSAVLCIFVLSEALSVSCFLVLSMGFLVCHTYYYASSLLRPWTCRCKSVGLFCTVLSYISEQVGVVGRLFLPQNWAVSSGRTRIPVQCFVVHIQMNRISST